MKKLECDVIRDLIPSYVEEICSETSKRYVDEHLQDCPDCDRLMRQLRDTDFSTTKLEQRQFDGYKKAKRQISQQSISGVLLAVMLVFSAITGSWLLIHGGGARSDKGYYMLLGISVACTIYYMTVRKPTTPMQKADWGMAILSILGTGYLTWLVHYSLMEFMVYRIPFGIQAGQFGSFVRYQFNAAAILQLVMYLLLLWRLVKKQINNGGTLCLCLTGICLTYLYNNYFGSMDLSSGFSENTILEWWAMIGIALGIGLLGIILLWILSKVWTK